MFLPTQLRQLQADLKPLDSSALASWRTGLVFNALLAEAQEQHAVNAVIASMEPLAKQEMVSGPATADIDVGTLAILVGQLLSAIPQPEPEIARW